MQRHVTYNLLTLCITSLVLTHLTTKSVPFGQLHPGPPPPSLASGDHKSGLFSYDFGFSFWTGEWCDLTLISFGVILCFCLPGAGDTTDRPGNLQAAVITGDVRLPKQGRWWLKGREVGGFKPYFGRRDSSAHGVGRRIRNRAQSRMSPRFLTWPTKWAFTEKWRY